NICSNYCVYDHVSILVFYFFFSSRRRHTRFKCDWSSDVCSSDLGDLEVKARAFGWAVASCDGHDPRSLASTLEGLAHEQRPKLEIGRASCRERSRDGGGAWVVKRSNKWRSVRSEAEVNREQAH